MEGVLEIKIGRNNDFKEYILYQNSQVVLRFASAYGFRNIQNLVRKVKKKTGKSEYHFVEVMACPSVNYIKLDFLCFFIGLYKRWWTIKIK